MTTKPINTDDFYINLGKKIKEFRKRKKLNQDELAQLSHLKRTSITNIENGKQKTPLHVVVSICYALEIELSDLIPYVEDIVGSKVSPVAYITVGEKSRPVSKTTANVVSKITKDL